jgi:hypothetical protein
LASGFPVITIRPGESLDAVDFDALLKPASAGGIKPAQPPVTAANAAAVAEAVTRWRAELLHTLGVSEVWNEDVIGDVSTDKPDWDGYGAVVLLAAYDEQPKLAPGARSGLFRFKIPAVEPRQFGEAPAFKAASAAPARYPTLLRGAEWCLPIVGGPAVFAAATPSGKVVTMGHVDRLVAELDTLNERTLRLTDRDLEKARFEGPSSPGSTVESMAAFGLGVLIALARFAASHRAAWIMDY